MNASKNPGPLMLDCGGLELTKEDRELIAHPLVGGIILFARNYESPEQVRALCQQIRSVKSQPILIAVDQEGGRVQRFQRGMTRLPPMRTLGEVYQAQPAHALNLSQRVGWLMATELRTLDVDFSFAPVLDLDWCCSEVIGNRAFAAHPVQVAELAEAFQAGVHSAGMATVGKHFPGHGAVTADSHTEIPVDDRELSEIREQDLLPFEALISDGLDAVMPAHVIYPKVDHLPAGFSRIWLQEILRHAMHFDGVIFSDDLSMEGARVAGDHLASAEAAVEAGCDMILVCNDRPAAIKVVDGLRVDAVSDSSRRRLATMLARSTAKHALQDLPQMPKWHQAQAAVDELMERMA